MAAYEYDDILLSKQLNQNDKILEQFRRKGCRITKQRKLIIDIILNQECSCCKEIYGEVLQRDPTVGIATVYRVVRELEEIGAIDRKNIYRTYQDEPEDINGECAIILKDNKILKLSTKSLTKVIKAGINSIYGIDHNEITSINLK